MRAAVAGPAALQPSSVRPFSVLPARHPARPLVEDLLVDLPDRAQALGLQALPAAPRTVAELRGTVRDGTATPERLYVSLQATDGAGVFHASTLHWSAGSPARWDQVPADPKLPGLALALRGQAGPHAVRPAVEVLRYVPLRRFTFRTGGRVVKVKRSSRLADSWARARALEAAVSASRDGVVRVPRLLGVDEATCSYAQADVPGAALADLATGPSLRPLLAEAGAVHAGLHRLDGQGLPPGAAPGELLETARHDAAWAATVLPGLAGLLRTAVSTLAATLPDPGGPFVTCHGDLVPSHLLGAPGRWTVIDADLAHRGDAARDVAMFVAGLAFDVAALADGTVADPTHADAVAAYLDGYRAAGGRLATDRLRWHLLAAHVHHAGLLATKDRADDASLAATAVRLGAALDALGVQA